MEGKKEIADDDNYFPLLLLAGCTKRMRTKHKRDFIKTFCSLLPLDISVSVSSLMSVSIVQLMSLSFVLGTGKRRQLQTQETKGPENILKNFY